MGCPSSVVIENDLTFSVNTHTPSTGAATDAASVPTYRVYEVETATPLLSGSMAKLDDANTLGFYTETIACTTANGFEVDKSYSIYVSATVGTIEGTLSYGFGVTADPLTAQNVWEYATRTLSASGVTAIAEAVRDLATSGLAALKALIDGIKAKTDTLPANIAKVSDIPSDYADTADVIALAAAIAGVASQTGQLTFTEPGKVDASATVDTSGLALEATAQQVLTAVQALATPDGAIEWLYELGEDRDGDGEPDRNEDGSLKYPIPDARVYATAVNNPGAPIVADFRTDAAGTAAPLLLAGTYYFWRLKAGYAFSNPDVEVVTDG